MDRARQLIGQMMTERTLSFPLITAVRLCLNTDVLIEHLYQADYMVPDPQDAGSRRAELEQVKAKRQE